MPPENDPTARRDLTAGMLQRLLERLGEDGGERYNSTRRRLVHFFRWRQMPAADDLADEVLNRVARRLADGEAIVNVPAYVMGVARLVALEWQQQETRHLRAVQEFARQGAAPPGGEDEERALECLDRCLATLAPDRRAQVLAYYSGSDDRIRHRREMAASLGVAPLALRNRMLRLRQRLADCVAACLAERSLRDASLAPDTRDERRPARTGRDEDA